VYCRTLQTIYRLFKLSLLYWSKLTFCTIFEIKNTRTQTKESNRKFHTIYLQGIFKNTIFAKAIICKNFINKKNHPISHKIGEGAVRKLFSQVYIP
jgi:hypothetical protein